MPSLIVVENPDRWPFELEGAEVVSARDYLEDAHYAGIRKAAVYNVCRHYGYQTTGYYVSLLAAARGHRPLPSVATLQSLLVSPVVRILSEDLDALIQRSLSPLESDAFELSVYFGRNVARRYDRLAGALFNQFPAPFLRARFKRDDRWKLQTIRPVATSEIPDGHRSFVIERAGEFFARPRSPSGGAAAARYDLAVLWSADDETAPSDEGALKRFVRAARAEGIATEVVGPDDYGRIAEFDALWIRVTTAVNHFSFRFAQRAEAEGLVVIDDPESIIRCTNKVYQAEIFQRHRLPAPATMVVHPRNVDDVPERIGLPCVLKKPDAAFSRGVRKAQTREELRTIADELFADSELVVAQSWTPSAFDWRIGILEGSPLYACKYHMARGHWQIIRSEGPETGRFGRVEAVPLDRVPEEVVRLASRAASLMGDGLYGVDLKEVDGRVLLMEVNDNPSLEAGYEDRVVGDDLYRALARFFRTRLDRRGGEPESR